MENGIHNTRSERIVLHIPADFTTEEAAEILKIGRDSAVYEELEDAMPLIRQYGKPKAVIRWVNVDRVEGDATTIEGVTFHSKVVADKLRNSPRVFISVATAGEGLEKSGAFSGDPFLDTYNGVLLNHAIRFMLRYMQENFGFDGSSTLNPGSLPDWPIRNNFDLFGLIGNTEEIGVSLNEAGYIKPWNSSSSIHFSGNGYMNCSLCKNYGCIGRRAPFNRSEYKRIFNTEP